MIRINLLSEEVDNSGLYIAQSAIYFVCLGLTLGACTFIGSAEHEKLESFTTEKEDLDRDISKLKKQTQKVEGLEEKKKVLKQKLMTISLLKAKKYGPVRVLDDLNTAVPERAWLKTVAEEDDELQIGGVALDDQTVSTFMVNLEESEYFSDIDLIQSREHEQDGVMLREFTLTAKLVNNLKLKKDEDSSGSAMDGPGSEDIDPPTSDS